LIAHRGTEVTIQNTTFGGIQGFTRKPSTPWTTDDGKFAGIVHQERNWTYVLFDNTGHVVPAGVPAAAYKFMKEFVLGNNPLGRVESAPNGTVTVVGGENATLAEDVLPGRDEVIYGSGTAVSTFVFPEATRSAWREFIRTETAQPTGVIAESSAGDSCLAVKKSQISALVALVGLVTVYLGLVM